MNASTYIAPGFEPVGLAFQNNFAKHGDIGAACAIFHKGKPVVDLWAGTAQPATGSAWQADTLQLCFSATKGITAICLLQLVEQGLLDLDKPIADYWPEFGCAGKEAITTRMVLSHRAGLAAISGNFSLQDVYDRQPIIEGIATQTPNWEPNTKHGYHVRAYGWVLGELLRRICGQSLNDYLQSHICEPLGVEFWVGVPESKLQRCATLIPDPNPLQFDTPPSELTIAALTGPSNLFSYSEMWNDKALLMAEMPSSNGVGTARALATIYAATTTEINNIKLLNNNTIAQATTVHSQGPDAVVGIDMCFGLGFMLPPSLAQNTCGPSSYGHFGAGGSFAMADPENELSIAYVMNQMSSGVDDVRAIDLIKAMYKSI
jgi:CubicO group peptidase (beta-lactamase class C family)